MTAEYATLLFDRRMRGFCGWVLRTLVFAVEGRFAGFLLGRPAFVSALQVAHITLFPFVAHDISFRLFGAPDARNNATVGIQDRCSGARLFQFAGNDSLAGKRS